MKSTELKPTKENLISTLKDDLLDRNKDLCSFANLLNNINESYSIALDSPWGSGKTFFVKQMAMLLNIHNPQYEGEFKKNISEIKNYLCAQDQGNCPFTEDYRAVYYDAWSHDSENDPILSMLFEISKSEKSDFNFKHGKDFLKIGGKIFDCITGKNISAILQSAKSVNPFEQIEKEQDLSSLISEFFDSLIVEKSNRLVIFVDELDRCKPTFAVELLERIKHYFVDERITFVFSINKSQLVHTIKKFYGESFDACRYLERFFDYNISLTKVDMSRRIFNPSRYYNYFYKDICLKFINTYNLSIRETDKYIDAVNRALDVYVKDDFPVQSNYYTKGRIYSLYLFVPIILGLKLIDINRCDKFISGLGDQTLMDLFDDSDYHNAYYLELLIKAKPTEENDRPISIIENLYNIIFRDSSDRDNDTEINEFRFNHNLKKDILRVSTNIAPFTLYQ